MSDDTRVQVGFLEMRNTPPPQSTGGTASSEGGTEDALQAPGRRVASCKDHGDGSYLLEWHSDAPGSYHVYVRIDGLHIVGSPALLLLDPPEKPKPAAGSEVEPQKGNDAKRAAVRRPQ